MEMLCQNMVDALQNVIRNVTPVNKNMVKVLPTVTDALLTTAFADLLPALLDTVTQLFTRVPFEHNPDAPSAPYSCSGGSHYDHRAGAD